MITIKLKKRDPIILGHLLKKKKIFQSFQDIYGNVCCVYLGCIIFHLCSWNSVKNYAQEKENSESFIIEKNKLSNIQAWILYFYSNVIKQKSLVICVQMLHKTMASNKCNFIICLLACVLNLAQLSISCLIEMTNLHIQL